MVGSEEVSQCWGNTRDSTAHKSFHQIESFWFLLSSSIFLHPLYFDSKIFGHNSPWFWNKFQCYFPNRAILNFLKSRIPNPPYSLDVQVSVQLTHDIFFWSSPPPHKNHHCKLSNLPTTFFGTLKKEKWKIGIGVNTNLIRVTLPPKDVSLSSFW